MKIVAPHLCIILLSVDTSMSRVVDEKDHFHDTAIEPVNEYGGLFGILFRRHLLNIQAVLP